MVQKTMLSRAQEGTEEDARSQRRPLKQEQGAGELESIMTTHGRTFAFAARFLPPAERRSTIVLYAFFRTLDDLVDERDDQADDGPVHAEIQAWRGWFLRHGQGTAPREPLGRLLSEAIARHHIPAEYFLDFLDGMEADLQPFTIAHFAQLRRYCYQVAATVGLAMAHVLGCRTSAALGAAEELGIAMQLTNILRDVGGDLARGRVYLPADELERFGLSRGQLALLARTGARDPDFERLMRFQIERAHGYYQRGMSGVLLLSPECRLPILIAGRLYRKILDVIERNRYDVLRRRAATSRREKLQEAAIAFVLNMLWQRGERRGQVETAYGGELQ